MSGGFVVVCWDGCRGIRWTGCWPLVTSGQWVWDTDRGDFDRQRSTAVPPALHGVFREEPRHLDLRWARSESELDLRHSRFRDAVAELAPAISACTQSHRVSG
jgi:hypothetical protein